MHMIKEWAETRNSQALLQIRPAVSVPVTYKSFKDSGDTETLNDPHLNSRYPSSFVNVIISLYELSYKLQRPTFTI